jgi:NAD(P)-dependent dehydrogenase (short-subunit alcohol dehydrogenase family)
LHERARQTGDHDAAWESFIARQPMGRMAQPEEIAHLAVYLASDESAYATGANFIADGGITL